MPTSSGSAQPLRQSATVPSVQIVDANNAQGVPCKFFQSGYCLKGDWCLFLHVPNSMKNKASGENLSKVENPILEKKVLPTNNGKPIKSSLDQQAAGEVKHDVRMDEHSRNKRISSNSCINELPDYNGHLVSNVNIVNQLVSVQQPHQEDDPETIDDKNVGDVSREPSPDGFDVLVDDEGMNSDFYHSEDRYGMSREYEAPNEYDIDHFTNYNMVAESGNDRYRYLHGYDSQRHPMGQCGLDRNRDSCERISAGIYLERRPYARAELDLRHHLARNKQPHVLRSVVCHDQAHEKYVDDCGHQRHWRHENSLSNRLRGRIRLPRRSPPPNGRERIRRDDNGRLYPARVRDRIKGRVEGASHNGRKNDKGLNLRRETSSEDNDDFAPPKSLAELKNRKNVEPRVDSQQQQLGKRKHSDQENGSLVSFEGPKPLEEILKRKRGEIGYRSSSAGEEDAAEDTNQKEGHHEANIKSASSLGKKEANGAEESYDGSRPVASNVKAENGAVVERLVDEERERS